MKSSCTKNNLQIGLAATSHLSVKNIQLPILNNVLIVAKNGNIRFTATNLEIAVSCLVRGKVEEEGEITVPSKLFFDYISLLKEEKIDFWSDEQVLHIQAGDYKTKINGLSSSDFPLIPSVVADKTFLISTSLFREAVSQVSFAVANNESRPELSGVLVCFKPNEIVIVATDSYRLAEKKIKNASDNQEKVSVIVPVKTIVEINRILSIFKDLPDSPNEIQIMLSENQIVFTFGPVELISRIIEGNFPDYQQIIPTAFQTEAKINREDLINAIKTASLFSRSGLFDVTVSFDPSGLVKAEAADATRGENLASTKAVVSGQENSIILNSRYLLDGLQSIVSSEILFKMVDGSNPCVISPAEADSKHLYVVMPIRQ